MIIVVVMLVTALPLVGSASSIAYGAGTVSATALNIREAPGTTNPIIGTLYKGDIIVVLDIVSDDWYHISYKGTEGYVAAMYITQLLKAENFDASGLLTGYGVRMRSLPGTDGEILGNYDSGAVMQVIGINNGWYKVKYDGHTGYIRSDFMEITDKTYAQPLGKQIAEYAKQYVGYSYIYGAESPAVGFDCSGLTYYCYGQFGYSLERRASMQYAYNGTHVSKSELAPGDLVFFSSNGGYSVTHVGIYIGGGQFVHASTSRTGVIISDLNSSYYTRVYYGATRIV